MVQNKGSLSDVPASEVLTGYQTLCPLQIRANARRAWPVETVVDKPDAKGAHTLACAIVLRLSLRLQQLPRLKVSDHVLRMRRSFVLYRVAIRSIFPKTPKTIRQARALPKKAHLGGLFGSRALH